MRHAIKHFKLVNLAALSLLMLNAGCSSISGDPVKDAQAAMASFRYEEARIHLANAVKEDPGNALAHFLNGQVALAMGNSDLAKAELAPLLKHPDFGKRARPLLAKAYLVGGTPQEALNVLAAGGNLNAVGSAVAVASLQALGKAEEANAKLNEALAAYPESLDLGLLEGARAMGAGDAAAASAIADRLIKAAPGNPEALIFAGRVALSQHKLDVAERHMAKVKAIQPWNQTVLLALAAIASDKGDTAGAKKLLEDAHNRSPSNPVSTYFLAQMAFDAGDVAKAEKLLEGSTQMQDQLPELAMINGLVSAERGNHEQAIASLRQFLALGGEDGRARLGLARSLAATGDQPGAWAVLKPLANAANADARTLKLAAQLASATSDAGATSYAARAEQASQADPIAKQMIAADKAIKAGNWAKADEIYTGLLAAGHSEKVVLLNNASAARLELGDAAKAIELARKAYALAPADPLVMDTLGWALFKGQGDGPEVRKLLSAAASAMPGNLEIRNHVRRVANAGALASAQ